jgi:hypothetical protein
MIQYENRHYRRYAYLQCDRCNAQLEPRLDVTNNPADGVIHRNTLRDEAQHHGWANLFLLGRPDQSDLCADCFKMPPEG